MVRVQKRAGLFLTFKPRQSSLLMLENREVKKVQIRKPILAIIFLCCVPMGAQQVLVEAESFATPGGWSIDSQYMDQMGSPFLLAHGLGSPVADAQTQVQLPDAGQYRVWVRTRDWVAHWKVPGAPGRFQLSINGVPVATQFGTEGEAWHWQDGGVVQITTTKVALSLHDLTGFDGRCDAVLFSKDLGWKPPEGAALEQLRRSQLPNQGRAQEAGNFDLVVVGGGMAGLTTAVAAARLGLQVAFIQDRPVLGGNSSSEIRVSPAGIAMLGTNIGLGQIEHELDPGGMGGNAREATYYADQKKFYVVGAEKSLHLFLNQHALRVEKSGNRITAVIARNVQTNEDLRFAAPLFADCTGDADIGFLAGADFRVGREGKDETGESLAPGKADHQVLGSTFMWYAEKADQPAPFPETPWGVQFNESNAQKVTRADWDWELGMKQDQIQEGEAIRDYDYRVIYGNWSFLKNRSQDRAAYERERLSWVAYIAGKRESRRLLGDIILQEQDILQGIPYPDASAVTTWPIDLHYPKPENTAQFPGQEFLAINIDTRHKPYAIPYRCFYSRNIENLFMAGRDGSFTHVALGTVRVQRTTAMMGEVVGMAAYLSHKYQATPREVYQEHLDELKALMQKGVGVEQGIHEAQQLPTGFSRSADAATWKPPLPALLSGKTLVHLSFHAVPDPQGDPGATIRVIHDGSIAVRPYNMTAAKDEWLDLGTFMFAGGGLDCVRLMHFAGGRTPLPEDVKFDVLQKDGVTLRTTIILKAAAETR